MYIFYAYIQGKKQHLRFFFVKNIFFVVINMAIKMLEIMKFRALFRALGLNLILDESDLRAQSLKVEAQAFRAFE